MNLQIVIQRAIRRIEDKRDNRLKTRAKTLTNHGEKL